MIPERDDLYRLQSTAPGPHSGPDAAAAASGANRWLMLWRDDDNDRTAASQQSTAWSRYLCYVEAMQSQGHKFDQKYVLEAMFRGNDLVYRSNSASTASV